MLEHVEDPAAAVARVASWLTDGGALVVAVPNLASLQARLGGERWLQWDLPRHRTHFTPAGLERLLAAHGLRVERTAHVLLEHNPFGMWQSLVSRVTREPSYLYRLFTRTARPRGPRPGGDARRPARCCRWRRCWRRRRARWGAAAR